jgi:hypothetical protein
MFVTKLNVSFGMNYLGCSGLRLARKGEGSHVVAFCCGG